MKNKKPRQFNAPMIAVDIVIFTIESGKLKILLIKRASTPFKGLWALPGGIIRKNESLYGAAARELKEETSISEVYLEQLYTFGDPFRDPRGRVVSVAYFALAPCSHLKIKSSSDAAKASLFSVDNLPRLAFDHKKIFEYALTRVRNKIQYTNAAWSLLPKRFTLTEIQKVYEVIWGRHLDKRNFRKKILSLGLLKIVGELRRDLKQRPARLFAFKTTKPVELRRFF